jgi:hypothetical protein
MRQIGLKAAAVEIRQAVDQCKRQKLPSSFFFMVGAGISHPPIPLAAEIQARCKEEAQKFGKDSPPGSDTPIDSYSYWFEQAYPHPENRQWFLRELMQNAFISQANFRLAHLLLESTVANLVVTANFDDFLSRALTLFGRRHIVCDHPKTLGRIDLRSQDVQIIHIHGSYWFYDCCNLRGEISYRAKSSPSSSFTMLSTLDDILRAHSPLVVGYSGWEGDVFITALQRRLSEALRTNLYWFCYRRRDAETLPEWLRDSPNVHAVVPDESRVSLGALMGRFPRAGEKETAAHAGPAAERDDPAMQATAVFDELIQRFSLEAPPLTKDPLGFFANHLKTSLLGDKTDEPENDVYAIRAVIERLVKLKEQAGKLSQVEEKLESFRNAVRQSDHRQAIRLAGDVPLRDLAGEQLRELISALGQAASALNDNSDEELKSYGLIVAGVEELEQLGPD